MVALRALIERATFVDSGTFCRLSIGVVGLRSGEAGRFLFRIEVDVGGADSILGNLQQK